MTEEEKREKFLTFIEETLDTNFWYSCGTYKCLVTDGITRGEPYRRYQAYSNESLNFCNPLRLRLDFKRYTLGGEVHRLPRQFVMSEEELIYREG